MALPQGFRLAAAAADFRGKGKTRDDLALVISERPAAAAGVFTTNLCRPRPCWSRRRISPARPKGYAGF